jgi:hypothetical protein
MATKVVNLSEAFKSRKTASEIRTACDVIKEEIENGKLTIDEAKAGGKTKLVSIRNLAEATLGADVVQKVFDPSKDLEEGVLLRGLKEAADPVKLSAFYDITGTLIVRTAYEAYTAPEFVGESLVTAESDREDNVRVAGLTPIDDDALEVAENEEYPTAKFGEDYVDIPGSKKRGLRIALTKELVFFDKTGKLAEMASGVGNRLGMNKEKRIFRVVLGVDNTFVRKGVARNTYVASADPRINKFTANPLVDWTSIDAALQGFNAYTDDRTTAEPISVMPDVILVPQALATTAARILHATEVREASNSGNRVTISSSPVGSMNYVTSPWIQWMLVNVLGLSASQAKLYWHIGQPKKAFRYRTLFPFAVTQQAGGDIEFNRDVVAQWKASERGVAYVWAPWYMQQQTGQ